MAKTFLDLVKDLHRESGAGGAAPSVVTGQTGESGRLVEWVRTADIEIQNRHLDWNFLWRETSLVITDAAAVYPPPSDHRHYDRETFQLECGAGVRDNLHCQDWLDVRSEVLETEKSRPSRVIVLPNKQLRFDQPPDGNYTCYYSYFVNPVEMTENSSESLIPNYYRFGTIVGKALEYYANYEDAPEARARSQLLLGFWLPGLEANQLPGSRYLHGQAEGGHHVVRVE